MEQPLSLSTSIDHLASRLIQKGDIIVAADNFGDSGEEFPRALKTLDVTCVIAASFTRSFYRNCINLGLPVIEHCEAFDKVSDGELISINFDKGEISCKGGTLLFSPFQETITRILTSGGLIPFVKKALGK
jgi:3-isopropylmalate/(R)-2-methylmalate dehydratase small subunit